MLVAFRQLSSHQCHYFNQVDNQYFSFSSPFFFFLSVGATTRKKSRDWSRGYYQRVHTSRSPAELPMGARKRILENPELGYHRMGWRTWNIAQEYVFFFKNRTRIFRWSDETLKKKVSSTWGPWNSKRIRCQFSANAEEFWNSFPILQRWIRKCLRSRRAGVD